MTENLNSKTLTRSKSYFRYMLFILILVQILDVYSTSLPALVAGQMADFFFPGPDSVQDSTILRLNAIISIGLYAIFFMQYLADKIGRKKSLAITAFGMGIAASGMLLAPQGYLLIYVLFWFFLSFFMNSDIWLIYVNEEARAKRRAVLSNVVLMGGLFGGIVLFIFRAIFIPTVVVPFWQGMFLFPAIFGIIMGIVILVRLKETTKYQEAKEEIKTKSRNFFQDVKSCFKIEEKTSYKFILLASFIFMASSLAYMGLKVKYFEDIGFASGIPIIILVNTFAVIIGYILNALSDRFGRKPIAYLWLILLPISVVMLVIGGEVLNSFLLLLLGNTLNAIAFFGFWGLSRLITLELLPNDRRGTGTGLRQLTGAIGGTVGMLAGSFVVGFVPSGVMFIIFSCLVLLMIPIIALKIKETKGIDLSDVK